MEFSKYLNSKIFTAIYIGVLSLLISCKDSHENKTDAEIESIIDKWITDTREDICFITTKKGMGGTLILKGETTIPGAKLEIINSLNKRGIVLIDSILLLPDTTINNKYKALVSLSVINIRKHPEHSSELVSQAILGTPVHVLKQENGWLLIQTPDRYLGWTETSSVRRMDSSEMDVWKKSDRVIFLENSGWVYSSPEETGVVGDIVAGSILMRTGELKGYAEVTFPDGREGYLKNQKVMSFESWKTQVHCSEESIIRVASTYLGIPYLWGGSSTKAVDCSGYVESVFFLNGLILSRDASLQATHGRQVDLAAGYGSLNKGDLLFFGSREGSTSHVTHVAIYIGEGEYINASGRVMIGSLDSFGTNYNPSRESSLLMARRIIGVTDDAGIVPVVKHPWY